MGKTRNFIVSVYIGCAVTLCSGLSQASCWSLFDQRGQGLLPKEVGVHVGIIIGDKPPAEAG